MEHLAIDLGGRESQICVRAANEAILAEGRHPTKHLGRYLKTRPPSRVIVETSAEAFAVADIAVGLGHQVRVVPATLVRSLGVGDRRTKTDKRDARILSEVSCRVDLPSVHIPSEVSRQRKTLCGMRESLLSARTQLINCVRGWLRTQARQLRSGTPTTFPRRVRNAVTTVPGHVERLLLTIEHLSQQIGAADRELRELIERDPLLQRLMSVPGVGPVTAIRFVAALDDVGRFSDAHQVESYLGLVPGERQSSERQHRTSITKAGSAAVRRTLIQAAWAARRARGNHPMLAWTLEVEKRRGKHIATVALARKIAGILYALWRDGTTYRASKAAT